MRKRQEYGPERHQAWNQVNFKRVRQQHLVNLEALLQEALRSPADLAHCDNALAALVAALLSTVEDATVVAAGVSGLPDRAARMALALKAAAVVFAKDPDQGSRIMRLAVEFADTAALREESRLNVIRNDIQQHDWERAYDLLTAPRKQRYDIPDAGTRALLAGQIKHTEWEQGLRAALEQLHGSSSRDVARGDQLHSERFLYSYDADLTAVIDARTTAAGIAAVKHLQETLEYHPGAALPTWLLMQLHMASGRANDAWTVVSHAAAALPHATDFAAAQALLMEAASSGHPRPGTAAVGVSQRHTSQPFPSQPALSQHALSQHIHSQPDMSQPFPRQQNSVSQSDCRTMLVGNIHSRAGSLLKVLQCDPSAASAVEALARLLLPALECQLSGSQDDSSNGSQDDRNLWSSVRDSCHIGAEGAALYLDMNSRRLAEGASPATSVHYSRCCPAVVTAWQLLASTLLLAAEAASESVFREEGSKDHLEQLDGSEGDLTPGAECQEAWGLMSRVVADRRWWWPRHVIGPATSAADVLMRPGVRRGVSDSSSTASTVGDQATAVQGVNVNEGRHSVPSQTVDTGHLELWANQASVAAFVEGQDSRIVALCQNAFSAAIAAADSPAASAEEEALREEGAFLRNMSKKLLRAVTASNAAHGYEQRLARAAAAAKAAAAEQEAAWEAASEAECRRVQPDLVQPAEIAKLAAERRGKAFAAPGPRGWIAIKPLQEEWWNLFPQSSRRRQSLSSAFEYNDASS